MMPIIALMIMHMLMHCIHNYFYVLMPTIMPIRMRIITIIRIWL